MQFVAKNHIPVSETSTIKVRFKHHIAPVDPALRESFFVHGEFKPFESIVHEGSKLCRLMLWDRNYSGLGPSPYFDN
jgi:hypothetical protein